MWLDAKSDRPLLTTPLWVRLALFGHAVKEGQDKSDVVKTVLVGDGMQKRPELQGSDLRVSYHRGR